MLIPMVSIGRRMKEQKKATQVESTILHRSDSDHLIAGRVEGSYSVWQPDGRLMTVTYYVDGESGFVPTITYTDNYTPTF